MVLSNSQTLKSEKTIALPEPHQLPEAARTATVLPGLSERALMSIGQCCNNGCKLTFDENKVKVKHEGKIVQTGDKNHVNKLCYFQTPMKHNLNLIVPKTNAEKLTKFMHGTVGSPTMQTFLTTINKGNFATWPQLNSRNTKKYIRAPTPTILGHLDYQRKNKLSTQTIPQSLQDQILDATPKEQPSMKTNDVYVSMCEPENRTHTDQTGKFPTKSIRGYNYIMITYVYDTNSIIYKPIKTKSAEELQQTYDETYACLTSRGHKPQFHRIDNETSHATKTLLEQTFGVTVEIVPPHSHRRNAAERAIRIAKNHLIAMLSATHENFPLHLWCQLTPQAQLTLNLLRQYRIHPHLSAHHSLDGSFDFSRTPLAPPGIKVIACNSVDTRQSWGAHGKSGH